MDRPDSRQPAERRTMVRDLAIQVFLVAGAALLYFGVRGLTEGAEAVAIENAGALIRFEERWGLAFEVPAQELILDRSVLVTLANWIYIWGHWPAVISVLLWLWFTNRRWYHLLFRAMLISGAIGLVIFATYPVTPPRLMPGTEIVDTVTEHSRSYRVLQPPALANKYAALPSLHVGWNLLLGIVVFLAVRRWYLRIAAVLLPALMTVAVVLTGNHYVVDGMLGSVVACVGLLGAVLMDRRTRSPATPEKAEPTPSGWFTLDATDSPPEGCP